jgi:hypothetical protein
LTEPIDPREIDVQVFKKAPADRRVKAEVSRGAVRVFAWAPTELEAVTIVRQAILDGALR